jgi:hypothetical protein
MSEDLLDTDVSNIDTSYPRVVPKLYDLEIASAKRAPNNAGTSDNINLELKTTSDSTSTTGEPVPAGFVIHHTLSLGKTPKYDPNKPLARLAQSAKLTGISPKALAADVSVLVGKIVPANVGIQKATAEYNERNTIRSFEVKA